MWQAVCPKHPSTDDRNGTAGSQHVHDHEGPAGLAPAHRNISCSQQVHTLCGPQNSVDDFDGDPVDRDGPAVRTLVRPAVVDRMERRDRRDEAGQRTNLRRRTPDSGVDRRRIGSVDLDDGQHLGIGAETSGGERHAGIDEFEHLPILAQDGLPAAPRPRHTDQSGRPQATEVRWNPHHGDPGDSHRVSSHRVDTAGGQPVQS
jgi:hypothetical protein